MAPQVGLRTQLALTHAARSADTSGPKPDTDMGQHHESASLCLKIERAGGGEVERAGLVPQTKTVGQGIEESCWQHLGLSPEGRSLLHLPMEAGRSCRAAGACSPTSSHLFSPSWPVQLSMGPVPPPHTSVNYLSAPSFLFLPENISFPES